jgi:hypothetical protein
MTFGKRGRPQIEEVKGGRRKLHNVELRNLAL